MSSKQRGSSAVFAPLTLSEVEERAVIDEAALIIKCTLVQETEFRRCGGKPDRAVWKQVRVEDGLSVYKQRGGPGSLFKSSLSDFQVDSEISAPELLTSVRSDDSSRWRQSSFDISNSSSSSSDASDYKVPAMLALGHIDGKLEDVMLGVYDGDDHAWRVRTALLRDKFEQAQILAAIRTPTCDSPFNFLGVKWFSIEYPPVVGSFLLKRDMLIIESLGIANDENGDKYGYSLLHDFRHPYIPELSDQGIVRGNINLCFIFRQETPTRVSVYARGFIDGGGEMPKSLGIIIASMSILSNTNAVETSYARKLAWLVTSQASQRHRTQEKQATSTSCHSCEKTPLLRGLHGCHACGFRFCSKCTVHRKVVLGRQEIAVHSFSFCFACVLQAKEMSPVDVARATLVPPTQEGD
ncbi:hypothetical protein Poli38472_012565 [Pythium oligandrum]|uniref:FYVE-type domain-containing protein n=1 Tax=Pythium oligandrum TaxID=41045 RepID=A0A8K1CDE9_PYTOL|nr:hypothetical protein Poli38472_012565 [Pythium oligandrum]|eukprot:TMW61374.1 hypothetical protein Poli38472_012565 [Pythium oligandrum]